MKAQKYATKDSEAMLGMIQMGMSMAPKDVKDTTYDKSNMEFGDAKIEGDKATVPVKDKKSGGTTNYTLKKEGGAWKVAFDKATMTQMGTDKMKNMNNGMDKMNNGMDSAKNDGRYEPYGYGQINAGYNALIIKYFNEEHSIRMLFILLWNYFSFKNPERVMKYLLTICVAFISFSSAAQKKNHIDLKN